MTVERSEHLQEAGLEHGSDGNYDLLGPLLSS